jgi:hypothetical protein
MATIPSTKIALVRKLYDSEKLSAREISEQLEVSLDAVYYILRKHNIRRRTPAENNALLFARKPLSYSVKSRLSSQDEQLKLTGCLLYWCEGYKTEKSHTVDFANSDINMVTLFLRFLRTICGVDESRLRVFLYCHESNRQQALIAFWSNQLHIPATQFTKPYVMKRSSLEKNSKMPYGLVHVRYADKKLLRQILTWIDEYKLKI